MHVALVNAQLCDTLRGVTISIINYGLVGIFFSFGVSTIGSQSSKISFAAIFLRLHQREFHRL